MSSHPEAPYFILFANCIPVKGASRSVICDLHRHDYDFIPNALYDMLTVDNGKPVREIAQSYGEENIDTVLEYFAYLEEKEYGFFARKDELELFPKMSLEWDHPSPVTNAILDMDNTTSKEWVQAFVNQLDGLMCQAVELRLYYAPEPELLHWVLDLFAIHTVESVILYFQWSKDQDEKLYRELAENLRLKQVVVHGCPDPDRHQAMTKTSGASYIFTERVIDSHTHCGVVAPSFFSSNKVLFTESQKFNSCLNRKVSMDTEGNICQCPSMPERFGHIEHTTISDAIHTNNFKSVWSIHKDQIDTCRQCEFRYICTDCRAWRNSKDLYSKPLKCHYDPHTTEWKNPVAAQGVLTDPH